MKSRIAFVHVPKTGGTYLDNELKKHFPNRYIRPTSDSVSHYSLNNASYIPTHAVKSPAINYGVVQPWHRPKLEWSPSIPPPSTGEDEEVMTVSICRNPFDHLVSMYHADDGKGLGWMNRTHRLTSFEDFIKCFCDPEFPFTSRIGDMRNFLYSQMFDDWGFCGVQLIIRNEHLNSATQKVISHLKGVHLDDVEVSESRVNASPSRAEKDYRSFYTDELRELVEWKCAAELFLFEYNFDGPRTSLPFVDPSTIYYFPYQPVAAKGVPHYLLLDHSRAWQDILSERPHALEHTQHILPDLYHPNCLGDRKVWKGGWYEIMQHAEALCKDGIGVIDVLHQNCGDPKTMAEIIDLNGVAGGTAVAARHPARHLDGKRHRCGCSIDVPHAPELTATSFALNWGE
tara:strand:+ start:7794 stop:8993 length:1200 start_codon:yes stop_codon:yes gene_type:complete